MGLYSKNILPKVLDFAMRRKRLDTERASVISQAKGKVLEIGFGSGVNIPHYKDVEELFALEPSEELFDLVKDKPSFILTFVKGYAEEIPFPDHTFDTVVSTWTLCSVQNPEKALYEIKRVLKPDGRFVFIEHGKSPYRFLSFIQKTITPLSKKCAGNCHFDRDIPTLINGIGFKELHIEGVTKENMSLAHMYRGVASNK